MDWAARGIGSVYVVAGLIALRQVLINWRLDRAISAVVRPSLADRAADVMLGLGAVLILASGLSLLLLQAWADLAFIAGWAAQAVYLLWAQRWQRPKCPISKRGRRETLNAFAVYSLATAVVIGLPLPGGSD